MQTKYSCSDRELPSAIMRTCNASVGDNATTAIPQLEITAQCPARRGLRGCIRAAAINSFLETSKIKCHVTRASIISMYVRKKSASVPHRAPGFMYHTSTIVLTGRRFPCPWADGIRVSCISSSRSVSAAR